MFTVSQWNYFNIEILNDIELPSIEKYARFAGRILRIVRQKDDVLPAPT